MPDQDWSTTAAGRGADNSSGALGSLRVALLFGACAILFALVVAPLADRSARSLLAGSAGLDMMSTGSVTRSGGTAEYTIRRSVLQPTPESVCIIRANGSRSGEC